MPELHDRFTVCPDVVFRVLGAEAILLNLESGLYFGLNEVGTRAWELLQTHDVAGACDALASEFDAPVEQIRADVLALTGRLVAQGLLAVTGDARG